MRKLRVLDLFSGIGGFSLGLERTGGFETVAFCEIEKYPRAVLAKHWPNVPCYDDVRTLTAARLATDGIAVDAICGGFPCQDISVAGKGLGLSGERSGLWREYARIIGEIRPRYVIVENVAALLNRGLADVLGDLAALGYNAEWHCIPASAVGAPHRRDRVWIVAYPGGERHEGNSDVVGWTRAMQLHERGMADASRDVHAEQTEGRSKRQRTGASGEPELVADAERSRLERLDREQLASRCGARFPIDIRTSRSRFESSQWVVEPNVGRVAHGVPSRVDRLRSLGNAVVPQIPELIGRAIMQAEGMTP